jgi:hypothetical protein
MYRNLAIFLKICLIFSSFCDFSLIIEFVTKKFPKLCSSVKFELYKPNVQFLDPSLTLMMSQYGFDKSFQLKS